MAELLKFFVDILSRIHDKVMSLNDGWELGFSDKQLHFLCVGLAGIGVFFAVQIAFKWLAKRSVTAISLIYTATLVVVATFAVEIGQKVSGTGDMEAADIYYGVWGFVAAFGVYLVIKLVIRAIKRLRAPEDPDNEPPGVRRYIGDRRGGRAK